MPCHLPVLLHRLPPSAKARGTEQRELLPQASSHPSLALPWGGGQTALLTSLPQGKHDAGCGHSQSLLRFLTQAVTDTFFLCPKLMLMEPESLHSTAAANAPPREGPIQSRSAGMDRETLAVFSPPQPQPKDCPKFTVCLVWVFFFSAGLTGFLPALGKFR